MLKLAHQHQGVSCVDALFGRWVKEHVARALLDANDQQIVFVAKVGFAQLFSGQQATIGDQQFIHLHFDRRCFGEYIKESGCCRSRDHSFHLLSTRAVQHHDFIGSGLTKFFATGRMFGGCNDLDTRAHVSGRQRDEHVLGIGRQCCDDCFCVTNIGIHQHRFICRIAQHDQVSFGPSVFNSFGVIVNDHVTKISLFQHVAEVFTEASVAANDDVVG